MKQFCNIAGLINILKVGAIDSSTYSIFCHTSILPYCYTAILPYCHTAILPYCHTAILPYCHTAILSYCHSAILLFCRSAMASIPVPLQVCTAHLQRHTLQTKLLNLHFPLHQVWFCTLMFQPFLVLIAVYDEKLLTYYMRLYKPVQLYTGY